MGRLLYQRRPEILTAGVTTDTVLLFLGYRYRLILLITTSVNIFLHNDLRVYCSWEMSLQENLIRQKFFVAQSRPRNTLMSKNATLAGSEERQSHHSWHRRHAAIRISSRKFRRAGGRALHGMPSDGWPSYFGSAAHSVPPATVLFRQETKLRETSSCLFPWVAWFRKTIASF